MCHNHRPQLRHGPTTAIAVVHGTPQLPPTTLVWERPLPSRPRSAEAKPGQQNRCRRGHISAAITVVGRSVRQHHHRRQWENGRPTTTGIRGCTAQGPPPRTSGRTTAAITTAAAPVASVIVAAIATAEGGAAGSLASPLPSPPPPQPPLPPPPPPSPPQSPPSPPSWRLAIAAANPQHHGCRGQPHHYPQPAQESA